MSLHCCDLRRLEVIRAAGSANGIEFLEVLDRAAPAGVPRQRTLFLRLLRPGFALTPANLRISGGERIATVRVLWCATADALPPAAEPVLADGVDEPARTLVVRTEGAGDFSTYTLSLVADPASDTPPQGFDPVLSRIAFSFKVECASDFDCAPSDACPPEVGAAPDIDYLAKDYQGFRRLMLDRMDLLVPGWTERSAADLGLALVELLAYAADNLSYRQDVIAAEAYLATARQRISVRRHARLVDYLLHEGCNARAFVHLPVEGQDVDLEQGTPLLTRTPTLGPVLAPGSAQLREALAAGALAFATAHPARLRESLNQFQFYTWGDEGCCLPQGTTRATLSGLHPELGPGTILVFEERVSPTTFTRQDADPAHRWAVRLTAATPSSDPSGGLFRPTPDDGPVDVTEIAWDPADALPFPLCLSVRERPGLEVSLAFGNIVIVEHGLEVSEETGSAAVQRRWTVPGPSLLRAAPSRDGCCGGGTPPEPVPARFRPRLSQGPLSHGFDLPALLSGSGDAWWPASRLLRIDPRGAVPLIDLQEVPAVPDSWAPRRDLLGSQPGDRHFVVEMDGEGLGRLRFGDDRHGRRPLEGTVFAARYRVGNGTAGNVGAEGIAHVVTAGGITAVRNPLPARGGTDPEPIEAVRRDAPEAFRTQERAVTAADYAAAAERRPEVQRASASFRWTGSWHTAFVTSDRFGGGPVDAGYATRLRRHLERFRMAGTDLAVRPPRVVPLDVKLHVCVRPDYFRAAVLAAVGRVLSSGLLPDGRLSLFHPDRFTFGARVHLSPIVAAAQAVEGVEAVRAERFQRLLGPDPASLDLGVVAIGPQEIAQLDNDPNFPERGRIEITGGGGK